MEMDKKKRVQMVLGFLFKLLKFLSIMIASKQEMLSLMFSIHSIDQFILFLYNSLNILVV